MAREIINVGATPNDGQGDSIRTAFIKTNNNFGELYAQTQTAPPITLVGSVGDLAGMTAYDSEYYYYCFANYDGANVIWREVPNAALANVAVISATGNITGNYFIGNGRQLTGVVAAAGTQIVNGNTNITTALDGNANITIGSTSNVAVFSTGGVTIIGNIAGGNLSATGNITGGNIGTAGTISAVGNITGGNVSTAGLISAAGNVTGGNIVSTGGINAVGNIITTGRISAVGNIFSSAALRTQGSISTAGNVTGNYFIGDGGFLSNVTVTSNVAVTQIANGSSILAVAGSAGNITIAIAGVANVAQFVPSGLSVVGNVDSANIYLSGRMVAAGNITASNLNATTNVIATGNVKGTNVNADLQMSAVGNITGGNLLTSGNVNATAYTGTAVSVTGNITGSNVSTAGLISAAGNITSNYFIGNGSQLTGVISSYGNSNVAAYLPTYSGNISASIFSATGNVNTANIYLTDRMVAVGSITAANINATSGMSATGNVQAGNVVSTGTISAAGNVIGTYFVGTATQAQYADIAENYTADASYEPGTVLEFGGDAEVTMASDETTRVAGVVSTAPAHLMNSMLAGQHVVAVALVGRVPCRVRGTIAKGDMLISAGDGYARAKQNPIMGTVIGKALESSTGNDSIIEVVVGRL